MAENPVQTGADAGTEARNKGGRPRKHPQGTEAVSFYLPPDCQDIVRARCQDYPEGRSGPMRDMLRRLDRIVAALLPRLSSSEWTTVLSALQWTAVDERPAGPDASLWQGWDYRPDDARGAIHDEAEMRMGDYEVDAFTAKIGSMGDAEILALVDISQRFWAANSGASADLPWNGVLTWRHVTDWERPALDLAKPWAGTDGGWSLAVARHQGIEVALVADAPNDDGTVDWQVGFVAFTEDGSFAVLGVGLDGEAENVEHAVVCAENACAEFLGDTARFAEWAKSHRLAPDHA